jgi:hypothetical protein
VGGEAFEDDTSSADRSDRVRCKLVVSQHPEVLFVEPCFHTEHPGFSLGCRARSVWKESHALETAGTPIIVRLSRVEHGVTHMRCDFITDDRNHGVAPRGCVLARHLPEIEVGAAASGKWSPPSSVVHARAIDHFTFE